MVSVLIPIKHWNGGLTFADVRQFDDDDLLMELFDFDEVGSDDFMGSVNFSMKELIDNKFTSAWIPVKYKSKKKADHEIDAGRLRITTEYVHDAKDQTREMYLEAALARPDRSQQDVVDPSSMTGKNADLFEGLA